MVSNFSFEKAIYSIEHLCYSVIKKSFLSQRPSYEHPFEHRVD